MYGNAGGGVMCSCVRMPDTRSLVDSFVDLRIFLFDYGVYLVQHPSVLKGPWHRAWLSFVGYWNGQSMA